VQQATRRIRSDNARAGKEIEPASICIARDLPSTPRVDDVGPAEGSAAERWADGRSRIDDAWSGASRTVAPRMMALSVLAYTLTRVMNIVGIKPLTAAIAA